MVCSSGAGVGGDCCSPEGEEFMRNYAEEKQVPTFGTDGSVGAMTPSKPKPIKQITILGERNSGTRWTYR